jgi:hypothetical protein
MLLAHAPLSPLKRALGVFLLDVLVWRRINPHPRKPADRAFVGIGAASGLGSALLGSVGPLTARFFLAYGLTRAAYIGTEAAAALTMHLTKTAAYGAGDLLTSRVLLYGAAFTPATLAARGPARRSWEASATACLSCSSRPGSWSPGCSFSLVYDPEATPSPRFAPGFRRRPPRRRSPRRRRVGYRCSVWVSPWVCGARSGR